MKKGVLLVNYTGYWMTGNTFIADNSLATLAGVLEAHHFPVKILDFQTPRFIGKVMQYENQPHAQKMGENLEKGEFPTEKLALDYFQQRERGLDLLTHEIERSLKEEILGGEVGFIGFKLWAGNGLASITKMARNLKAMDPSLIIFGGGPAAVYAEKYFLNYSQAFDFLVVGEGEEAILDIVTGKTSPANTINKLHGEELVEKKVLKNLDQLPLPTYSSDVYMHRDDFFKIRIIDESRGCFNRCSFCAHRHLGGGKVREKQALRVVDEIERIYKEEKIEYFRFSGSNTPRELLLQIAQEILRRRLEINYSAFSSMNNLEVRDLSLLARSGLRSLFFGLESGNSSYLRKIHNKTNKTKDHIIRLAQTAMREGIFITLSTIVPSPFETEETKKETRELLAQIFSTQSHGSVLVSPAFLTPGSLWWEEMEKYGFSFEKGMTRESYIQTVLDWSYNHLLPSSLSQTQSLNVLLNGKNLSELFRECQQFAQEIKSLGISLNIDDASYMIAHLGKMDPREYIQMMMNSLLKGGTEPLREFVERVNRGEERTILKKAA